MSMSIGKRFISSPSRIAPSVFSLATVNPTSTAAILFGGGYISSFSNNHIVGTGTAGWDVNLQAITCLVPAVNDVACEYNIGGTDEATINFDTLKTSMYPTATACEFVFLANFLAYAPANISQRVGLSNDITDATPTDCIVVENVTAGTLRLRMRRTGTETLGTAVAVAAGMHTHRIVFDDSSNIYWYIDGLLVYSDVTGTAEVPYDQALGAGYYVMLVALPASGTYDLNLAFFGWGLLYG